MIEQLDIDGRSKIDVALERIKHFEPAEGYYLAFSGGKDSIVCKELLNMAKVKYDAHYNVTTVDPPELIYYMREHHKDVIFDRPERSMWQLIADNGMPPTRIARYCCAGLKEGAGGNRFVITGVRWAESVRRRNSRSIVELHPKGKSKKALEEKQVFMMSDNMEKRKMIESCTLSGKLILNPIVDWYDDEVWEFIRLRKLPYCELYDQGQKRIGCIGCPLSGSKQMRADFKRYPQYKKAYIRSFDKMLINMDRRGCSRTTWETGEDVMKWWIGEDIKHLDENGWIEYEELKKARRTK